jgi:fructose-1,6-bisphosphatase-3
MGAACGNEACIATAVRNCSRYDNLATLEEQYGINIRPLSVFAGRIYKDDDCKLFFPKTIEGSSRYSNSDKISIAKIHKAISIIQFKVEAKLIKKHPEYKMKDRLFLDKIDFEKGTVHIDGKDYKLKDCNFPTVDPKNPYELTSEEAEIMERLKNSFEHSEKLIKHVNFLYAQGGVYEKFNNNVLFHGCIPMTEKGEFEAVEIMGKKVKGKELMDSIENIAHKAFFGAKEENSEAVDLMWYFWCGAKSPLFGKDKAATFERYFLEEKELHKENKNPYYKLIESEEICDKILENFGATIKEGHIINGHMPVKAKDGETPIRARGKYIVIDGGFSKAYQPTTGIAGYTLSYNSNGLVLAVNEPFESKQKAIEEGSDIKSEIILQEHVEKRKRVADTDIGEKLQTEINDLKQLLSAYREGIIKEKI